MNGVTAPQVVAIMEAEAERLRLQAAADQHRADARLPEFEYEVQELDNETIAEMGAEYGLSLPELVARLKFFIEWAQDEQ